jgi:hypothetical protein
LHISFDIFIPIRRSLHIEHKFINRAICSISNLRIQSITLIKRICIGRFWNFYRLNFALKIIMFMLNISFEIWSWLNFFRLLDIRIFRWWILWVAMVNMICCMDFIYIFMITYVVRINMIMHNTTFVKWFDHFGIGPTFVKIMHHIR